MASLLRRSWLSGISATEEGVAAVWIVVVWFNRADNLTTFSIACTAAHQNCGHAKH